MKKYLLIKLFKLLILRLIMLIYNIIIIIRKYHIIDYLPHKYSLNCINIKHLYYKLNSLEDVHISKHKYNKKNNNLKVLYLLYPSKEVKDTN